MSGIAVRVFPRESFTVAFIVAEPPEARTTDVADGGLPAIASDTDRTGQVVNCIGCETAEPTLANSEVVPGIPALAIC